MRRFECDGSYKEDLKKYTEEILKGAGISSPAAEREILYLADKGNTAACKLYGDLLFYKKLIRKDPYRDAFGLYLRAAGIRFREDGTTECSKRSYPAAFWNIGYYLMNYRRESFLKDCEEIPEIEKMSRAERVLMALELSEACIREVQIPGAVNLIGRILKEASEDEALLEKLMPVLEETAGESYPAEEGITFPQCRTAEDCAAAAEVFFEAAADAGYSYACNNLAIREADRIITAQHPEENETAERQQEIEESVGKYVRYLQRSADKYEPYAANRLGLFYLKGEIKGSTETVCLRTKADHARAREYFQKAIVYPDRNSAWGYYNLIRYFYKDYVNDLDLLGEHMECIRRLNPEVYDLAMDL